MGAIIFSHVGGILMLYPMTEEAEDRFLNTPAATMQTPDRL
jgi:hypothetical protein